MGQYYVIANFDKKERLFPFDYDNGLKLMEWSYTGNEMVLAFMDLMANEWKGDRVMVVGDYADSSDPDECWVKAYNKLVDEFGLAEFNGGKGESLYTFADTFARVMPDRQLRTHPLHNDYGNNFSKTTGCTQDNGYRHIYNHATRQHIDLDKLFVEWAYFDKDAGEPKAVSVSPLSLLLTMGNGRGGGDYHDCFRDFDLVGSWCNTVTAIEVSDEPLPGCESYSEFIPCFTENTPPVPHTEREAMLAKCSKEHEAEKEPKQLRPDFVI